MAIKKVFVVVFLSSLTMWISLRWQVGVMATLGHDGKVPFSTYFFIAFILFLLSHIPHTGYSELFVEKINK